MAADVSVYVDVEAVSACASDLRNVNKTLSDKLENIERIMTGVQNETTYSTDASRELVEKFKTMSSTRFPEFKEVVESYAKFLDNVADTHKNLVTAQTQQVQSSVEGLPPRG